jgi:hypothetical protein
LKIENYEGLLALLDGNSVLGGSGIRWARSRNITNVENEVEAKMKAKSKAKSKANHYRRK